MVYSYDANGNLLNRSGAAGNSIYSYDACNRLISYVADHGAKQETYAYDAEGVRRAKTTVWNEKQEEILFISDTTGELSRTLAETDEEGNILAAYTWGDTLLAQTRDGKTSTYMYDGHGDVRGLLDEKGILTDTYSYNAYGELTEKTGGTENHFLYTGEYYDGVSGLYYLRARYMNPATGTFISMDSYQGNMYEPVTLHKYLYANADPVTNTDPSGMFSLEQCNISVAVGTVIQNQTAIKSLGVLMGVGNAAITTACGGSAQEIMEAFGMGFLAGVGAGLLICGVVVLNVLSIFEAGAIIATSALWVGLADLVLLSVLMVYSVCAGNEQQIMTYAGLLMTAFMEVCMVYGAYGEVTVSGEKGSRTIDNEILNKPRTGEALKVDKVKSIYSVDPITGKQTMVQEFPTRASAHGFTDILDNYAGYATKSQISNGTLYQIEGSLNGVDGRFEWILQDGQVTHRMFVKNGTINGVPIKP